MIKPPFNTFWCWSDGGGPYVEQFRNDGGGIRAVGLLREQVRSEDARSCGAQRNEREEQVTERGCRVSWGVHSKYRSLTSSGT